MEDYGIFEGLFTEIATPLINGTLSKMAHGVKAAWGKVEDHRAAKAYRAKLEKRYGTIQILGQPEPQKLGKVYTDVYLHDRPTHSYAMEIQALEESFKNRGRFGRDERVDGLEVAKQQNRLFILGKPGAGKTTFMKYLTIQATKGAIDHIPVFVSLNNLANKMQPIFDYIVDQFDACAFPDSELFVELLLQKGKALILFDGLDEIQKENETRKKLTQELKDFIDKYEKNRFTITCRIAASNYDFINFKYVEMADFTNTQVESFVEGWFAEDTIKLSGFLEELSKSGNRGIREMATSPLLLTLLCIQYDGSMAFPPFRSEIYEKALTVLLESWDTHRSIKRDDLVIGDIDQYKALTTKRKMQLMSRLAYHSFKNGDLFISQRWVERRISTYIGKMPGLPNKDLIDGKLILKGMESQHGLLVERADRIFSFSHLTLQEYFVAKYIADHNAALSVLVNAEKLTDPRWREVFLFVAELLPEGDEFVMWMAQVLQEMANNGEVKTLVSWGEDRTHRRAFARRDSPSRINYIIRAFAQTLNRDHDRILALAHVRDGSRMLSLIRDGEHALNSALIRDLDHTLTDKGSRLLIRSLTRARTRAFALARDRRLIHDQSPTFINDHDQVLSKDRVKAYDRAQNLSQNLVHNLANRRERGYYKAIQSAIDESIFLNWPQLTSALEKVPRLAADAPCEEWHLIVKELDQIEKNIILDSWKWEVNEIEDVRNLIIWINGHELLLQCLSRVVLENLDHETFEDKMLYCLPKNEVNQMIDID